jgi:hypothetical protein
VSNVRNPFRPVKFEDEEHPLLYISELAKKQFVIGNFYFTGKRGCGKTTCLKIADTEFQLNDSVSNNKLYDEIANTTLGVYLFRISSTCLGGRTKAYQDQQRRKTS